MLQGNMQTMLTASTTATVLLIEADSSLRRLIALGLQHQGMQVIEASSPLNATAAEMQTVDLLVLDVDYGVARDWSALEAVRLHPQFSTLPIVVLAWDEDLVLENAGLGSAGSATDKLICLAKPFDARILHQAIGQLLQAQAQEQAEREAQVEAVLLASYAQQSPPSFWPLVTAVGVLLAFIGMMLQVAVAVVGLLIVALALLLWTLDAKSGHETVAAVSM
ncbi:response regulator transcription factor [Ktedonosporobacter rubrisoli]|uniref:Response regulator transcription factor n=1 Tax=Ktedonosporobacter rubrisoli TaxID=2509675 RepID=A0A4P6K1A3_KTERU|nr:response regulator transcription factor [Ktedonosporobacter rubrisoli]QBD81216.1 response regulator transcription factor [Ktedonosporobacter rubrisoli]